MGINFSEELVEVHKRGILENKPIIELEGLEYIYNNIFKEYEINSVLEIGTCIGFSTLCFSSFGANVTSIEIDSENYLKAVDNINYCNVDNINLILGDALEIDNNDLGKFDMIFLDAAKAKNFEFMEKYFDNLNENGIFVIDNLEFHGWVHVSSQTSKNLRQMISKLKEFRKWLFEEQDIYEVIYSTKGDGIAIIFKK